MITNHFIKLITLFSFVFYLGCDNNGQSSPPPIPRISLSASPSSIVVGDSLTVDVNVSNIEDLSYMSFGILFDPTYLDLEVDMESGVNTFNADNGGNSGSYIVLDTTLGVLSVALSGNEIDGNIYSFTIKGIKATMSDTELELDEGKVNLLQADGMDVSDLIYLILRDATISVTDE